jgi:hypothetical protein
MPRDPQFFTVPAVTVARRCGKCPLHVYWIFTENKKRMPVDVSEEHGGFKPSHPNAQPPHAGRGISHFITCPGANDVPRSR